MEGTVVPTTTVAGMEKRTPGVTLITVVPGTTAAVLMISTLLSMARPVNLHIHVIITLIATFGATPQMGLGNTVVPIDPSLSFPPSSVFNIVHSFIILQS